MPVEKMTPEELERHRQLTIEMLHPELKVEIEACASAMEMTYDEFMEHLRFIVEDDSYYIDVGDNEAYKNYDWAKIWSGYELFTGTVVTASAWGRYPGTGFNCAC